MPKQLQIDPGQTYTADTIRFADIPVHAYQPDLAAERERWGEDRLRCALRDMLMLREFESMLHAFKSTGRRRQCHGACTKGPDFWLASQSWRDSGQGAGGDRRDGCRQD